MPDLELIPLNVFQSEHFQVLLVYPKVFVALLGNRHYHLHLLFLIYKNNKIIIQQRRESESVTWYDTGLAEEIINIHIINRNQSLTVTHI